FRHAVDAEHAIGALGQAADDGCTVSPAAADRLDLGQHAVAASRRLQLAARTLCLAHFNEHARSAPGLRFIPFKGNRDQLSVVIDFFDFKHADRGQAGRIGKPASLMGELAVRFELFQKLFERSALITFYAEGPRDVAFANAALLGADELEYLRFGW